MELGLCDALVDYPILSFPFPFKATQAAQESCVLRTFCALDTRDANDVKTKTQGKVMSIF